MDMLVAPAKLVPHRQHGMSMSKGNLRAGGAAAELLVAGSEGSLRVGGTHEELEAVCCGAHEELEADCCGREA